MKKVKEPKYYQCIHSNKECPYVDSQTGTLFVSCHLECDIYREINKEKFNKNIK